MEARSLSSLNFLAANPPQYPVNPAEQVQEPLTLYISRVPGTRDVILSPFRPQVKNVTAEDVASSLYYIHWEMTRRGSENPRDKEGRSSSDDGGHSASRAIPRKPLPGEVAESPTDGGPHLQTPLKDVTNLRPADNSTSPYAVKSPDAAHLQVPLKDSTNTRPRNHSTASTGSRQSLDAGGRPYMAPPGPTPTYQHDAGYGIGLPENVRPGWGVASIDADDQPPPPPPHAAEPFSTYDPNSYTGPSNSGGSRPLSQSNNADFGHPPAKKLPPRPMTSAAPPTLAPLATSAAPSQDPSPIKRRPVPQAWPPAPEKSSRSPSPPKHRRSSSQPSSEFTLTLIRRDPSSGNQWNVGRVSSSQLDASAAHTGIGGIEDLNSILPNHMPSPMRAAGSPPIDIALETSGYAKFRNMPASGNKPADLPTGPGLQFPDNPHPSEEMVRQQEEGQFTRQVVMAYSKSWSSAIKEKIASAAKKRERSSSNFSISSLSAALAPSDGDAHQPGQGLKPRGYVFTSPWDGRCEFRTGNAGRSVRCHHILHDNDTSSGSMFNPLVSGDNEGPSSREGPASTALSELRFNLPTSELFNTGGHNGGDHDTDGHSRSQQWRGHFNKLLAAVPGGEHSADDDYEDAVSPFDVNVGAEKAGGGNRGKRAKLGKLIIYNDGLKMLDLIVAANIGVWWRAWERNF